jgi:hypothetical protein
MVEAAERGDQGQVGFMFRFGAPSSGSELIESGEAGRWV